jgi:hypothetical protein
MRFVEVSREISAPPARVWDVLTNRATLASGTFGITKLDGDLKLGGRMKLFADVSGERAFNLRVATFEPNSKMVWTGGMPLGLFTGTRTFTLKESENGTQFHMIEVFTGLMSGLIWKSMPDLNPSFQQFAEALDLHATGGNR